MGDDAPMEAQRCPGGAKKLLSELFMLFPLMYYVKFKKRGANPKKFGKD